MVSSSSRAGNGLATYTAPWPVYALAWSSHAPPIPSSSSSSSASSSSLRQPGQSFTSPSPNPLNQEGAPPYGARLAIGSLMEEYSNSMQLLGYIGERDPAGQPRLTMLANASHPYPATKIAFQPSSLSAPPASSDRDRHRNYMSPNSKLAKRGSWGTGNHHHNDLGSSNSQQQQQHHHHHLLSSPSPEPYLVPNDEAYDGFPNRELLASTADCLRIWECSRNADGTSSSSPWQSEPSLTVGPPDDEEAAAGLGSGQNGFIGWRGRSGPPGKTRFNLREKSVLAHSKSSTSPPAPLTSFSWNQPSPNLIVTSSIDTTCTVWDLPTRTALTQLIAHDREVYDVDWCPGSSDVFASVGADGSVRVFDLRSLEHSTIIYETAGPPPPTSSSRPGTGMSTSSSSRNGSTAGGGSGPAAPLLRIAFNPWDANYLATFHLESDSIQILDVRAPGLPILELKGHRGSINAVAWGPPSLAGMGGSFSNSLTTPGTPGGGSSSSGGGGHTSSSSSFISKGMICTASDDAQVLVYDLASSTLRSASAQGRRSRSSTAQAAAAAAAAAAAQASPGSLGHNPHSLSKSLSSASLNSTGATSISSSMWASGIPLEAPFMVYEAPEMVNNVAWFRPAGFNPLHPSSVGTTAGGGTTMQPTGSHGRSSSVAQEWNEYTAHAKGVATGAGGGAGKREDWMVCAAGREVRALRVA